MSAGRGKQARAALLQSAMALQQAGALPEARKIYEQVLRGDPRDTDAMHLLGLVLIELGTAEKGFQLLRRAAAHAPRSIEVLNNLALELCRAGRFDEGLVWFDKILAWGDAPVGVHYNRARALRDAGRREEALASYERVIALDPNHADAQSNRGAMLVEAGRTEEALAAFDAALRVAPGNVNAICNRGKLLRAQGRLEEALAAYDAAVAAGSEDPSLLIDRGAVLFALGRKAAARACYEAVLSRRPDDADAWFHLGVVLRSLRQPAAALSCYDRALAARPDFADALNERGIALLDLHRHEEAAQAFAAVPACDYAPGRLLHARMFCCDWSGFEAMAGDIALHVAAGDPVDVPFSFLAHQAGAASQRRCAEIFVARTHPVQASRPAPAASAGIRLAYLSADFRPHPMAFLMAGVFEQHDRSRFETVAISFNPPHDSDIGRRVSGAFEHFIDVSGKTDSEVVALLREMRIDVAIDLMGHTANSRTDILALRAAPVQINYLGYPGTMGADYIDAIIADSFVVPLGSERFYTERVIRLHGCFQANDDRRDAEATPARSVVGLPESGFVFCVFSSPMKIIPSLFDVWMRLLDAVPGSVLWMYADSDVARANLALAAASRGVAPARLIFAPLVSYPAHLGRLPLADLLLDTFPFNGGATVSDALWAGVPAVTWAGEAFASRMAGSLLNAVGLADLIAGDIVAYEAIARRLAEDASALGDVKRRLVEGKISLFDTRAFCRGFEEKIKDVLF